ncbi:alkaline phosphatase family protein [Acidianus manzaensis]|uniref:Acid phosphatase n=1 Tax=Acidianus manzaensis TaxID=282676 RepID=A0A1W6JWM2_9CREN|nr:alkaline phosphatase family protein [Acidianus manzaensis]ARM74630.1 acid phosphatase [Acidianus manzaensis]
MNKIRRRLVVLGLMIFILFLASFSFASLVHSEEETSTPIKHVVIIILENHSFDNIFGTYPFGTPEIINNITESVMRPVGLNISSDIPKNPSNLSEGVLHPYYANSIFLRDPTEGYTPYHIDWNNGSMNGFVEGSGTQSLAYLSYEQVPLLWDYAEEYTLADNYFSPVLAPTQPNRVAYLTGYPTSVIGDNFVSSVIPFKYTILYQLSENGVSWAYFDYGYKTNQSLPPFPLVVFSGSKDYSSHYFNTSQFIYDLKTGNLPSVSWLMFTGGDGHDTHSALDLHPPYNLTEGQVNLSYYINAIMDSKYWNSTAIFITFDEGGGFYDQVPPPIIYTYGEGCDHYLQELGIYNYSTLGQRIPLLIISPYSKEGFINNYTLSGYTILAFIDYNWHLPFLTQIVANSDLYGLLQSFNFSMLRPPVIITPKNWTYPIPLQYPIHYGYVAKIYNNYSNYYILYKDGYISNSTLSYVLKFSYVTQTNSVTSQTISTTSTMTTSTTNSEIETSKTFLNSSQISSLGCTPPVTPSRYTALVLIVGLAFFSLVVLSIIALRKIKK